MICVAGSSEPSNATFNALAMLEAIKSGELTAKDRVIVTRLLDIQPKQEIVPVLQQSSTEK